MDSSFQYRAATPADIQDILSLYEEWGYTRGSAAEDMIWVAEKTTSLVGVCRVAPEFGTFVFRGLYVTGHCRGQGIGSGLAQAALAGIARECYCLPEPHLVQFYSDLGFKEVTADSSPSFLKERLKNYHTEGYDVVVMRRG